MKDPAQHQSLNNQHYNIKKISEISILGLFSENVIPCESNERRNAAFKASVEVACKLYRAAAVKSHEVD